MTIEELCTRIELQDCVAAKVKEFVAAYDFSGIESILKDLITPQTAEAAYKRLNEVLSDDEDCMQMLACQLLCATRLYDTYQEKGISQQIYVDTMKCFTRFIGECKEKTGKYAFDRAWWTYRQISMSLFRIGELEYELLEHNGNKTIDVHIPSDAHFTPDKVDESIKMAKKIIKKSYSEYEGCDFTCDSWLLSPKLKEVLKEDSNILSFQNRFVIKEENKQSKDIFEWLFKTSEDAEINRLREDTSLQRKAKQLLLQGDNIGTAYGVMKESE